MGDKSNLESHLKQVQGLETLDERVKYAQTLNSSDKAQIILDLKNSIIAKVEQSIPENFNGQAIFILGYNGSGKSTILNYLVGGGLLDNEEHKLLPNIGLVNDLALIDYPGFNDTNCPLIALAMELALKTLLKKYPAKILAVEGFDNKYYQHNLEKIDEILSSLVENKEEASTLGLTKYSLNEYVLSVKSLTEQKNELPLTTENELNSQLKMKEKMLDNGMANDEKEMEEEIQELKRQLTPLKEKSKSLSKQIVEHQTAIDNGLSKFASFKTNSPFIRFNNLEDLNQREEILKQLSSFGKPLKIRENYPDFSPAEDRLYKDLHKTLIEEKKYVAADQRRFTALDDFKTLESIILDNNLLFAIESQEMGELLALPEIHPNFSSSFDQKLIDSSISNYIAAIVGVNLTRIKEKLGENQVTNEISAFENWIQEYFNLKQDDWETYKEKNDFEDYEDFFHPSWLSILPYIKPHSLRTFYFLKERLIASGPSQQLVTEFNKVLSELKVTLIEMLKIQTVLTKKTPEFSIRSNDELADLITKLTYKEQSKSNDSEGSLNFDESDSDPALKTQTTAETKESVDSNNNNNNSNKNESSMDRLKRHLDREFGTAGGFLCFRFFKPNHVSKMIDANNFEGVKELAEQARQSCSLFRQDRVHQLYRELAESRSADDYLQSFDSKNQI